MPCRQRIGSSHVAIVAAARDDAQADQAKPRAGYALTGYTSIVALPENGAKISEPSSPDPARLAVGYILTLSMTPFRITYLVVREDLNIQKTVS